MRLGGCALVIISIPAWCAENGYVGARVCGSCHPAQFAAQSASAHAHALHRAMEHPLAENFTPAGSFHRPPNFGFRFVRGPRGIEVQADDSRYLTRAPADWAFGAGSHAVTFVGKASDELYLEHAFTFYSDSGTFALTPQHETLPAKTLHEAMGQAFRIEGSGFTIRDCFQCHSTGPVSVTATHEIQVTEAGVRCEVCHGEGRDHAEAARHGEVTKAQKLIRNPKTLSGGEVSRLCGTCHRSPDGNPEKVDWYDPWNVRHQPPYLRQSRCFQGSAGKLSCITCHNPHEKLRRNDADYYREICLNCHERSGPSPKEVCKLQGAKDCTLCHMPQVAANAHLNFRNHWIGVYSNGATLRPQN